ncbi:SOS response-associated peptidase [Cohnella endophytica]|uniref:Abasic site processing protein n=1 Tax=Cohnella endophytica TaxID=2419778 RepID=A0A494XH32_9BACL|nr:SOS response-associated peptidase [Cohnella endophytica]RKP50045.1 SOS response-associated peptidase [Cohnella endophytica]
MCGRYTIVVSMEELMMRYLSEVPTTYYRTPRYNLAPMQTVPAVVNDGENNRLGELRWGLVPSWAKDDKIGSKMINARAETILEKASFKGLIRRKRAIVPADGFYEWKKSGNEKQPMRITMKDGAVFSMAALYDTWQAPDGRKISTCTIITTTPNSLMAGIHDRMPVILRPEDEAAWLDRGNDDVGLLTGLLLPYEASRMRAYPVSPLVGNVKNDAPELIEEQMALF